MAPLIGYVLYLIFGPIESTVQKIIYALRIDVSSILNPNFSTTMVFGFLKKKDFQLFLMQYYTSPISGYTFNMISEVLEYLFSQTDERMLESKESGAEKDIQVHSYNL